MLPAAWRLHARAQAVATGSSLADVRRSLLEVPVRPGFDLSNAAWTARAVARAQRLLYRRLESCLLRSLVTGALLADREEVVIHVGFRRTHPEADLMDGHAWLTVGGQPLSDDGQGFEDVLRLPMERVA